jgi:putative acetyltransferase
MRVMVIRSARFPDDLSTVRALFQEYARWLREDLCFQGFEEELATLPGKYSRPGGDVLLCTESPSEPASEPASAQADIPVLEHPAAGRTASGILGCVAYRPFREAVCEMKRLWLRPTAHGLGYGRALVLEVEQRARADGYGSIVLDTLERMSSAVHLYRSLGYGEIPPYYHNPLPGAVYLSKEL